MQNFQYTFETRKRSSISALSICMTVLLKVKQLKLEKITLRMCVFFYYGITIKTYFCQKYFSKILTIDFQGTYDVR